MIDNLALLISHGLLMLTAFRLLGRADLDSEAAPGKDGSAARWGRRRRA